MDIASQFDTHRSFFRSGGTRSYQARFQMLAKMERITRQMESEIIAALQDDLHKCDFEAYTTEIGYIYGEIKDAKRNLKSWMRPKRVRGSLATFPSTHKIHHEPYGVVLVLAPWNYPFQLSVAPLIGAIAAGNAVILKPSEWAPSTEALLTRWVEALDAPEWVSIATGGVDVAQQVLELPFNYIFFTGSTAVGRKVQLAAAERLIPTTLELGGKSPCIVDPSADLRVAARRIVWGKFINAGQTCIAPDYILVHASIEAQLIDAIKHAIQAAYGSNLAQNPEYGRIIHEGHFDRLVAMIDPQKIAIGGLSDRSSKFIEPTVLTGVKPTDAVMQEEIFGPILPVLTYSHLEEAIQFVQDQDPPLALYHFTSDTKNRDRILTEIPFGGGCVNDTLMHIANPHLPFGGVGASGIGAYHGKYSFELFSHRKSITTSITWLDIPLRYAPFGKKLKLVRKLLG